MLEGPKRYLFILVIAAGIIAAVFGLSKLSSRSPIPEALRQADVGYQLYYPRDLPTRVQLMEKSIHITQQAVIMRISDTSGKTATLTEQRKVAKFDYTSLIGDRKIATPLGPAVIGTRDNVTTASLLTDTTWILVRTESGFPTQTVEAILTSLQPVQAN